MPVALDRGIVTRSAAAGRLLEQWVLSRAFVKGNRTGREDWGGPQASASDGLERLGSAHDLAPFFYGIVLGLLWGGYLFGSGEKLRGLGGCFALLGPLD